MARLLVSVRLEFEQHWYMGSASPSSASVDAAVKELLGEARALRGALLTNS